MKSHYRLHSLYSFAAAISNTIPTTIATVTASNLIMKRNLFVFRFFPARYQDPILPLVRALELWVCRRILGCRRIPLLTKISHQWSWFDPRELPRSVFKLFALLRSSCLHPTSLISVSGFCSPSFTHGPCNYCSFEFRPWGTILKWIFAGCFRSLFTDPFPAFRASRWSRHFFPLKEPLLTLCKDERYFTLFARYSYVLQWAFCHC